MKFFIVIIAVLFLLPNALLAKEVTQNNTIKPATLAPDMPHFVSLTSHVMLDTDVVRLSDIFQGAGDRGDSIVAYAPRPGGRAVFDRRWLRRLASAYKLNWRPSSKMDRIVIERASKIVRREEVENLLYTYMVNEGGDSSSRAVMSNRSMKIHLPTNTVQELAVQQMSIDQGNGRFSAILTWGTAANERLRVNGRFVRMIEVPVLANRVMRGATITPSDIKWLTLPEARLSRTVITDMDMLVGMATKRAIQPGKAISANDVRRPLLVNRGEIVTMLLTTPYMQLSSKGKALQSGSVGDTIRISNLRSNTVIDAVVTGSAQVRITMGVNLALR
ncbi:MAG: flagellar basal body P-ring formation protein FlgA [Magnetovibrio sp.]|nr:flagellar basal body P-ring formation protein FlgA [Magnetovibrio sp.]